MDNVASWAQESGVEITLPAGFSDEPERDPRRDFGGVVRGTPRYVLRPADVAGLSRTLRWLAEQRQPYRLRGAGWSSGGQVVSDGGAVVDLGKLDRIVEDRPDAAQITVGGGATWLAVGRHLRLTGRRPLVIPDNPRMTVGGSVAVADVGDTSSVHGSVISQVVQITLVTPDGEIRQLRIGDKLFRYTLGGAGLTGAIAEVTLRTMRRPAMLVSRNLVWTTIRAFLTDAVHNSELRLYEVFQGVITWVDGAPAVYMVAGNFADAPRPGEPGLFELGPNAVTGTNVADRFETLCEPTAWDRYRPSLEIILPITVAAEGLGQLSDFIQGEPVLRKCLGSVALLVMKTDARYPLAPQPESPHAVVAVIRPSVAQRAKIDEILPFMRTIATRTLEIGGKIGFTSIELELPTFAEIQLATGLEELRRIRSEIDAEGLCNRGVLGDVTPE